MLTWTGTGRGAYDRRMNERDGAAETSAPGGPAALDVTGLRMVAPLADYGEEGGEPVCLAHLVCEECGAVTTEGHRDVCSGYVRPAPG
jgi:hypothetical protein